MPFKKVKRFIYKRNPLDNVVCQLRFNPILRIDTEIPADFQNSIKEQYPNFEDGVEVHQEISAGFNPQFPGKIENPLTKVSTNKNYSFISEDGFWRINLTRNFISISTSKYNCWEDFIDKFKQPLLSLEDVYKPLYFTRIGLRYVDVFCRSQLKLEEVDWSELIEPQYLGLLASDVRESVNEFNNICEIKLIDDISNVRINSRLVKKVINGKPGEKCFLVDSDFYTPSKVQLDEVCSHLEFLHDRSSRLIRSIMKDKLHKAMEPQKYEK